ncbi:MAG: dihydrofolate reductase [Clostridia bacterium]
MQAIVAVDKSWGIGKNNEMLFHMPADLAYFKQKTLGKVIVMGGNTLLSFPHSRPLPGRTNIVLSDVFTRKDCIVVPTLDALREELKKYAADDVFIVGGAMFYRTMLPYCSKAYVTKVDAEGNATHFFNNLDTLPNWQLESESSPFTTNEYNIRYTVYKNNNPQTF